MIGWCSARAARLVVIAVVAALVVSLLAPQSARGWHDEAWVEPLLDRSDYTVNVVRGDGYLAWTEADVCCTTALGNANGAGFIQPESARTFKTMLRTPRGDIEQLSPDGTWAMAGGIDRGVLAYATGRARADIRLLDLKTRARRRLPRGVNTRQVEYGPSISGRWLLFGRVHPHRDYLRADTEVVLTDLKTGRSRVLAAGKNYRTYTYPGQVNGDWLTYTACKWNKYGPNCGVSRYRISTGEKTSADLDGSCCTHGDPHTENYKGAPGGVASSAVTADGIVYMAMTSGQNTSWCGYTEVWAWDTRDRLAYMFGEYEDDPSDGPLAGLVVTSLYVDGSDPHRVVFDGYTTWLGEDPVHGHPHCFVETSALYVMGHGSRPSATPTPSPAPSESKPAETATPSPTPAESEPAETATPSPTPEPTPSPTPTPSASPTPQPTSCPLPVCI